MKRRQSPESKLLPLIEKDDQVFLNVFGRPQRMAADPEAEGDTDGKRGRRPAIKILEVGLVGSLDYKIIEAGRADDLFEWLKDNKYSYSGDEATLQHYIQKKWLFTVMKIDTMQMKRNKDGTFDGEVTPTRFKFSTDKPVYPLKITQISVREKTEALFYVQAPFKVDLADDFTYQFTWIPMLQGAVGCSGGIPGGGQQWLDTFNAKNLDFLVRARPQNLRFPSTRRHTTLEWARKLSKDDVGIVSGKTSYSERVPDVDEGFTLADIKNKERAKAIAKVIRGRLAKAQKERPIGYLVREAPADEVKNLQHLAGHLSDGWFITKFRKIFARDEMNDDLLIVPARYKGAEDRSEYEELLPTSPP
jgi:hypothetical protein